MRSRLPSDVRVLNRREFKNLELAFWSNEHPAGTIFSFGAIMGFVVGVGMHFYEYNYLTFLACPNCNFLTALKALVPTVCFSCADYYQYSGKR